MIQWTDECPDIYTLRPSKVILDNGKMKGSILRNGSFTIPEVAIGTYVLSVVTPDHSFDQLRIDVVDMESEPQVRPYVIGTPLNPPSTVLSKYPIILSPKSKYTYFVPRESFNIMGMLSNPMTLMMVVGGAMMLAMPYLMKNMDPEVMEEFKEQHAKMTNFQNAVTSGDIKTGHGWGWSGKAMGSDCWGDVMRKMPSNETLDDVLHRACGFEPSSTNTHTHGPIGNAATGSSDIDAYLSAHNKVRAQHGAAPLTWSNNLASKAQTWANNCVFKHSGGSLGPFGENLAAGTGSSYGIPTAIKGWTDEVSEYDPSHPTFSHFTQVVWKSTTQVGCAVQLCDGIFSSSFGKAKYYVCEYSPAGNIIGQFAQNVQV
ncbi:hypothetical protein C0993_007014 [Termitomyces sp. T159_Od127]|nr:hypothetical protein C0993_007014 [Termitomyces sp. T159_Od127]